jgi:hypothetical protein
LSNKATTITAMSAAITVSDSEAGSTPLYQLYQESFGRTPFILTVIFDV